MAHIPVLSVRDSVVGMMRCTTAAALCSALFIFFACGGGDSGDESTGSFDSLSGSSAGSTDTMASETGDQGEATTDSTDGTTTTGGDGDGPSDVEQMDSFDYDEVEVLVYRIDFVNAPLEYTEQAIMQDLEATAAYYDQQSYGRFTVNYTIHPEVFHAPNNVEDYEDWYSFVDFYEASIQSTGVDATNPGPNTRIMVTSPQVGDFNSSGGPPLMTVFHYGAGTVAHELGHTLGLRHSRSIEAGDKIIGQGDFESESLDYGNVYCMMGMGAHTLEELNLLYKSYFGWLLPDEVPRVTQSGTYRIHAFDQGVSPGEHIGLTVHSGDGEKVYWVEYRVGGPYDTGQGVLLNLQGYFENETQLEYFETTSYLLDMTPGSKTAENWWADDLTDAELTVGNTFEDPWGGFRITPVATSTGETGAQRWIDLEIEML